MMTQSQAFELSYSLAFVQKISCKVCKMNGQWAVIICGGGK